jgi:uncharacterized protein with PQ loop repeat
MNFIKTLHIKNENENNSEIKNVMSIQDLLTYSAALLGALAFLWSAFRLYKTKKPQRIDIDIYIIFFISQILWIINAVIDKDYLLLIFYSINIIIYFYIFFYHSKNNI